MSGVALAIGGVAGAGLAAAGVGATTAVLGGAAVAGAAGAGLAASRGASAAKSAAATQARAQDSAIAEQQRQFDTIRQILAPYVQAGSPELTQPYIQAGPGAIRGLQASSCSRLRAYSSTFCSVTSASILNCGDWRTSNRAC